MTFAKWLSLGVGFVTALVVAALLFLEPAPRLLGSLTHPIGRVAVAAIIGAMIGVVHWLIMSRFESEVRRLGAHAESLARHEDQADVFRSRYGLSRLARAIGLGYETLRRRVEQLTSKRRELEVQLRIAEAERCHAEAILNSISDAVLVTDAFNELALANESAGRVLGFDVRDARRKPIEQLIADVDLVKLIKDTREGGPYTSGFRRHIEHRFARQGGEGVYDVTIASLFNEHHGETEESEDGDAGESSGIVTVLRDVTREREIAELKRDFVSSVSHELRTPLSSIKAYMEMLVDGEAHDDATRAEFYNIIQGETNRLSRLIDNILNISRIESGVIRVQREQISLQAIVREVVDVMLPQARAKGIELTEKSSPVFYQVFADKDMIHQATINLISNAIKYTQPSGRVTVAISVDDAEQLVHVSVADTGVGIAAEHLPHVFDKFYRIDNHKKMAKGTGLGLNLVKQIIETVHGGRVSVESELGKGAVFTYSLPLADKM